MENRKKTLTGGKSQRNWENPRYFHTKMSGLRARKETDFPQTVEVKRFVEIVEEA